MQTDSKRLRSIDEFRGLAIVLMVLANYLAGVEWIPAWLKHSPDVGLTVIDIIAPMFIFAIGLTYGLSYRRRIQQDGAAATYRHFLLRFLAILGIGAILSAGQTIVIGQPTTWGVLEAIGVAGLVTLPFLRLSWGWRISAGLAILAIYQVLLDQFWLQSVLSSSHGGLQGAINWSAMLLLSTALADVMLKPGQKKWQMVAISFGVTGVGIVLSLLSPISKNRVSSSYILTSLGISATIYVVFHLVFTRFRTPTTLLSIWGKNPLLLYVLHEILIGLFFLPGIPAWYEQAPLWLVLAQATFLLGALSLIALWMDRKKLAVSL